MFSERWIFFNVGEQYCGPEIRDVKKLSMFLHEHLSKNRLLHIFTDPCSEDEKSRGKDHWFVAVSSGKSVYVMEWSHDQHIYEEISHTFFIDWMISMMIGRKSDRHYKISSPHTIKIWAYDRKAMSKSAVIDYIQS